MSGIPPDASRFVGLGPSLQAGIESLSASETVRFVQYVRYVLPLDGFVFWLRTAEIIVSGSLHVSVDERQNEDETLDVNRVIFTTQTRVDDFNDVAPNTLWVGESGGTRFAFSQRGPFYENAGTYHYACEGIYPAMESQFVDVGAQLSEQTLVVSNSLPAWLSVALYSPIWLNPANPGITLFPSYAVPLNQRPPYGVVHIPPDQTRALQGAPVLTKTTSSHFQLAADRVSVTLYGLTNDQAMDWMDTVLSYSRDYGVIGMMSPTIVRDDKRPQVGANVLAMRKTVVFDVSYNQTRINDVARQLVAEAAATVIPQDFSYAAVGVQ